MEKIYDTETSFAELSDRTIAYRSYGKGKAIIFVNRFRGTLDTWDPLFVAKMAEKFNVIVFDYSGIGSSTGSLAPDITVVAKDVKDLADFLKLDSVIVLGWSYGGLVAQTATLLYPNLVTHAVLVGTNPPGKNEIPIEQAFFDAALKPVNDFEDEIVLFFEPKSESSRLAAKASHDRIHKKIDGGKIPSTMDVFQLYFGGGDTFREDALNFREQLKKIKTPILIISGDHDISFAVENWYPYINQMTNAQMIVYAATGHGPQHQYPELTAQYIINFVEHT
ncbi:Sigma factor SigB regulation protein RsbQ [Flavobacterium anhuiense]|jgi:pimeloyl-ACP methyl ester carboxylesterase|uniref:Sigma factor SigB regulation protein RsbQ n=1 Tax=Flavobacterium anhuiense TaxID=459526 RepID=A0AAC9D354_9FLAO|nr:alpha/beta hydrolase [Flavobacterium anhuiense]AOC97102.1 Sigma factor SigB regulation protein RsbQ [Flavobacterium anhuiense]